MNAMRRFATFFSIVALVLPIFAGAAETALKDAGYTGKDDICMSEKVSLKDGTLHVDNVTTQSQYENCKRVYPDNKCPKNSWFSYGIVRFAGIVGGECRVSKCDPNYESELSKCLRKTSAAATRSIDLSDPHAGEIVASLNPDTEQDMLTQILQDMGVPVSSDDVKSNPSAAKELAVRILDGDPDGAEAAAHELGLNRNLSDVRQLAAERTVPSEGDENETPPEGIHSSDTFGAQSTDPLMDRAKEAIATIESGGRYYLVGRCTRGDCPYGKYQVMGRNIPSWTYAALGRALTPQEFLNCPECQEKTFERIFGGYAQKYGYEGAARAWFAGEGGMWGNSRDILGTSVSSYAYKFNCIFSGQCSAQLASNPYTGGGYGGSPFGNVNPFASTAPVGYSSPAPVSSAGPYSASQSYPAQQASSVQQAQPQPVSSQLSQGGQGASQPVGNVSGGLPAYFGQGQGEPVASLVVQPREVKRGGTFLVAWSTVGMSASSPCELYLRADGTDTRITRGNEGSRTITTSATSTPGSWDVTLRCTSAGGTSIERAMSVSVQ